MGRRGGEVKIKTRRAAFTLIELTLVTVILLVLAGLSLPLFKRTFSDLAGKNEVFNISKLANYAQERAIIERKNFKIVFDFKNGQYQMFGLDELFNSADIKGRPGKRFSLPQGMYFNDPKNKVAADKKEIVFYPDGRCDAMEIDILRGTGNGYRISGKGFGSLVEIKEIKDEK